VDWARVSKRQVKHFRNQLFIPMLTQPNRGAESQKTHVSTGRLPDAGRVRTPVDEPILHRLTLGPLRSCHPQFELIHSSFTATTFTRCAAGWLCLVAGLIMKRLLIVLIVLLGLMCSSSRAAGPDYLNNNLEPADQVSQLATPFTPLTMEEPQLRFFNTTNFAGQPFIQDSEFGLQPRLYYRSLQNGSGVNNTFAGGGKMGFTSGWWRDRLGLSFGAVLSLIVTPVLYSIFYDIKAPSE
jgi:hypothetical protein